MSPEIALQKAVLARLVGHLDIIGLVPAANILDRNERPNPSPSIIIGEKTSRDDGDSIERCLTTVFLDLHVWKKEPSTAGVTEIAGAIRAAIKSAKLPDDPAGFHFIDAYVIAVRVLRDPDGLTSHAVVTVEAKIEETT